ncbi:hypothetical protein BpHYR1_048504 [Brachionus plicatilis]|uniref:Uncharacterized protein n=1 Tax=Brachionus plicatilis TaxID=10195 RepID=A0A3M7SC44_BRAPC|nr:hypothetical protein BpHYR1_048504 [Brachionus plicatilis]
MDGNLLEKDIRIRCHTTDLQLALGTKSASVVIKRLKLDCFHRILNNPFTKELMIETPNELSRDSFLTEIINYMDDIEDPLVENQSSIIDKIKAITHTMEVDFELRRIGNENVNKIKEMFAKMNKSYMSSELFNILKF